MTPQIRLGQPSGPMRQEGGNPKPSTIAIATAQAQGAENLGKTPCPSSLRQPTPQ